MRNIPSAMEDDEDGSGDCVFGVLEDDPSDCSFSS